MKNNKRGGGRADHLCSPTVLDDKVRVGRRLGAAAAVPWCDWLQMVEAGSKVAAPAWEFVKTKSRIGADLLVQVQRSIIYGDPARHPPKFGAVNPHGVGVRHPGGVKRLKRVVSM